MRNTKHIVSTSSKSNVGKTTVFVLAAFRLARQGRKIHLVDSDPRHESMTRWLRAIEGLEGVSPLPFTWSRAMTKTDVENIPNLDIDADIVLVDIEGGNDELAKKAAEFADLVVIATSDSGLEWITVEEAVDVIELGEKRGNNHADKAILYTRMTPGANTVVKELGDEFLADQEERGVDEDSMVQVFENFFPRLNVYKNIGLQHPDEVKELNLGDDSHIAAISDEMIETLYPKEADA